MNLTAPAIESYIVSAPAKSGVGFDIPFPKSALALIRCAFFVPALWRAVLGTSVRRFSLDGMSTCTACHQLFDINSGSPSDSKEATTMQNLSLQNQSIRIHDGLYSLNDLHQASGATNKDRPHFFFKNKQTDELVNEIEKAGIPAFKIIAGRNGGTFACKELVYAYAMWISPAFNLHVIRAFDAIQAPVQTSVHASIEIPATGYHRYMVVANGGKVEYIQDLAEYSMVKGSVIDAIKENLNHFSQMARMLEGEESKEVAA